LKIDVRAGFDQCPEVGDLAAPRGDVNWAVSKMTALVYVVELQVKEFEENLFTVTLKCVCGSDCLA
jgi:hypothetical protein